jgi:hypothetical protein
MSSEVLVSTIKGYRYNPLRGLIRNNHSIHGALVISLD